ncbi:MAG TPA: hypothetical protein D7I07_00140 [Candidatus Poseidoniales archaeon]|nr:MAG TPA: hypothetical protein D7I07_00140 [Candidatus Poseidoniales archaeon]
MSAEAFGVSDLVQSLITGFFTSIILLLLVYFFWRLYDRPSKKQIELEQETREKRKEERMWQAIEAEIEQEREHAEALATIERKKADMRARAQPPAAGVMQGALATLDAPTEGEAYLDRFKPNLSGIEEILVDEEIDQAETDDSDVLLAPELVEVRQDEGEHGEIAIDNLLTNETADSPKTEDLVGEESIEYTEPQSKTEQQALSTGTSEGDSEVDWNQQEEPEDDGWAVGW